MPVCDSCGADVDGGSRFCGECGALVRDAGAEPARTPSKTKGGRRQGVRDTIKDPRPRGTKEAARPGTVPAVDPPRIEPLRTTMKGISSPPLPAAGVTAPPMSVKAPALPDGQKVTSVQVPPAPAAPRTTPAAAPSPSSPPLNPEARTEFQRLLDEVESGFDAILVTTDTVPPPKSTAAPPDESMATSEEKFDHTQAKELFGQLVVANAQPIRDFMIEVRLGEPHAAWLDYSEPAVTAILRSAEGMGLPELVTKLRRFIEAIQKSRSLVATTQIVRGDVRESLIDAYSDLISFFPEAFAAEAESNKREAAIVRSLLSKVPGLFQLGLDRIDATGLASLGLFYVSRPREIAELAGVSLEIAERIVERFREYRRIASEMSPARGRADERTRLRLAVEELSRATRAYDNSDPVSAERRVHRRERALAWADVSIYLARLGEVDRMRQLETTGFAGRLDALYTFLEEAERKARAEQRIR